MSNHYVLYPDFIKIFYIDFFFLSDMHIKITGRVFLNKQTTDLLKNLNQVTIFIASFFHC